MHRSLHRLSFAGDKVKTTMPQTFTKTDIRRLAVMRQRLAGPRAPATADGIMDLFRALRCVQIDPLRAVERTQLLVLWSRLGPFDPALLDQLQQEDRAIFEAWAHAASYVLTEDYPLHVHWMKGHTGGGVWGQRVRDWMDGQRCSAPACAGPSGRGGSLGHRRFRRHGHRTLGIHRLERWAQCHPHVGVSERPRPGAGRGAGGEQQVLASDREVAARVDGSPALAAEAGGARRASSTVCGGWGWGRPSRSRTILCGDAIRIWPRT